MHLLNRCNFENAITLSKNIDEGFISSSENIARLVDLYNDVSIEEKYSIIIHNMTLPEYSLTNTLRAKPMGSTKKVSASVNSLNDTKKSNAGVNSSTNTMKLNSSVHSSSNTTKTNLGVNSTADHYSAVVQIIKEKITNES